MGLALRSLFTPSPVKQQAHELYVSAVTQARQPFLYTGYQVPDTLDGRFDAIVLHVFLLMQRLKEEDEGQAVSQLLFDVFFADMDRTLREMGVGDTGVGKRIKKMASAFLGRLAAYEQAADEAELAEALARNLYRGADGAEANARKLAQYAEACKKSLKAQKLPDILENGAAFVS